MNWSTTVVAALIGTLLPLAVRAQNPDKLFLTVGKSLVIDSPVKIRQIATANGDLIDSVAIGPKEVLINGKAPGETSLIVWRDDDSRVMYDLVVRASGFRLDAVREEIAREVPGSNVNVTFENETAFVRGQVKDAYSAARVMAIASTLGKAVNLLRVNVPQVEPQILLRVRFADVDRSAATDLGLDLASSAFHQATAIGADAPMSQTGSPPFLLNQAINLFLFRRDLNLAAALKALETKRQLEMLAEPNLLVINNTPAHFVSGGEFPFPVVQPGGGANAISIAFKEYGIKLGFLPVVTPRGTIRLQVSPEVSALDYTNSVTVAGTTVPGTSTRRIQTEVELESGQSFVIAGLLDRQTTETLSRIPGIASIPVLGKLFQTRSLSRTNSELLVLITPELVRPIPKDQPPPDLLFPLPFLPFAGPLQVWQPGPRQEPGSPEESIPFEQLVEAQKKMPPLTEPAK